MEKLKTEVDEHLENMMEFLILSAKLAAKAKASALETISDIKDIRTRWSLLIEKNPGREFQIRRQYLGYMRGSIDTYKYHMKNVKWAKDIIYRKIDILKYGGFL